MGISQFSNRELRVKMWNIIEKPQFQLRHNTIANNRKINFDHVTILDSHCIYRMAIVYLNDKYSFIYFYTFNANEYTRKEVFLEK